MLQFSQDFLENINDVEKEYRPSVRQGGQRIQFLYKLWKEGDLILSPPYQREFVWNGFLMEELIKSILRDESINVIHLACHCGDNNCNDETLLGKYEVIDGKQRLTTIFNFIDNHLDKLNERNKTKFLQYYVKSMDLIYSKNVRKDAEFLYNKLNYQLVHHS